MWTFVTDFIRENGPLSVYLGVALVWLTVAALASAVSRSASAYVGTAAILAGGWLFLRLYGKVGMDQNFTLAVAVALCYGGFAYMLCGWIGWAIRRRREKKDAGVTVRNLQYALPAHGNEYVRSRLHAISKADDEICQTVQLQAQENLPTELAYARELLAKLREKELSVTDRLQAEDLGKLFALYGKKEGISYSDVRTVNDGFCCLLKLAAKYSVEP